MRTEALHEEEQQRQLLQRYHQCNYTYSFINYLFQISYIILPQVERVSCHCLCLFDEMLQHCEVPYLLHKVQSQRSVLHWVESCPVLRIKF